MMTQDSLPRKYIFEETKIYTEIQENEYVTEESSQLLFNVVTRKLKEEQ